MITCPNVFSFIENPSGTLATLKAFVRSALDRRLSSIRVDQHGCEVLDLGAEAVASVLAREASRSYGKKLSGVFPTSPEQQQIVRSVGMPQALGISAPGRRFLVFGLKSGRKGRSVSADSTQAEKTTEDLVRYIDRCLREYGHSLTQIGKKHYSDLVGEVITNAEDHSRRGDWWVSAYLRRHAPQTWADCHLTVFSFGDSLAESLHRLPPEALLRKQIENLVHRHRKWWVADRWQPTDLWTLYALQGRVSRRNAAADYVGDRGQGTADMIETFQGLSSEQDRTAKMCVLSGNTHILFDDKYRMQRTKRGRIIAFNRENSLSKPPDRDYVRHIDETFPGTLISLQFFIDQEYLHEVTSRAA